MIISTFLIDFLVRDSFFATIFNNIYSPTKRKLDSPINHQDSIPTLEKTTVNNYIETENIIKKQPKKKLKTPLVSLFCTRLRENFHTKLIQSKLSVENIIRSIDDVCKLKCIFMTDDVLGKFEMFRYDEDQVNDIKLKNKSELDTYERISKLIFTDKIVIEDANLNDVKTTMNILGEKRTLAT